MRLAGKVAIITGAASGMGRATALRFCHEGASVALFDRDLDRGETVLREIRTTQGKAMFFPVDVSVEAEVSEAIRRVDGEFHRIDILVNNAAAFVFGSYQATQAHWERVFSVNVMEAAFC